MSEWRGDNSLGVAILRVSSRRQQDNISHDVQEKEIEEYCRKNRIQLKQTFRLIESAKDSENRKKFTDALAAAVANNWRHVLFYMYDREARNMIDTERNEKLVKADVIAIHYVRENKVLYKGSPDSDFFMRDVQAVTNKHYSRNLASKVNDAMRQKAESGWYPSNRPPLGYVPHRSEDGRGMIVVPDPEQRKIDWVRMEFDLRARGLSYPEIRKAVAGSGLLTPAEARRYKFSAVEYRIKNAFYEGFFLWQGTRYRGKHELIIPSSTIAKARANRGEQKQRRPDMEHGVFGGGWMRCAECECLITYDPKKRVYRSGKRATFHFYRCSNGRRAHASFVGRYAREEALWAQFDQAVDEITITPELATEIAKALNESDRQVQQESTKRILVLEKGRDALVEREDRVYEDMIRGVVDQEQFRRVIEKVRADRARIQRELDQVRAESSGTYRETAATIIELATSAKSLYLSRNPMERREFLENILSNPRLRVTSVEYDLKNVWGLLRRLKENGEWWAYLEAFRAACARLSVEKTL